VLSIVASRQGSVQFVDWVRVVVRRRKKRKRVRRLIDCILVGDAKTYVFVERFLSRSSLNLESLIVIRVVLDVEIGS
jgi:hypothetical protein